MKRKILSLLLCVSMTAAVLAGCGTKDVDATNDEVSNVKVTKKLEEEYVARIEAYQEYYEQIKTEYDNYVIGATITLDREHLPLLWVVIGEDNDTDSVLATQLVGYEDKQAIVLAEAGELLGPYRGDLVMAVAWATEGKPIYLYDEEKQDFTIVNDELEYVESDGTVFSEEELNHRIELYQCVQTVDEMQVAVNKEERKIAYLGECSRSYAEALLNSGVFYLIETDGDPDYHYYEAVALRSDYADNKAILKYFEQLPDYDIDSLKEGQTDFLSDEDVDIYKDIVKQAPYIEYIYTLPNGTEYTDVEANWLNVLAFEKLSGEDNSWKIEQMSEEAGEFLPSIYVERIMRGLLKKPVYTQEELYLYLASVAYDCDIIEIDVQDYSLADASNNYISNVIGGYMDEFFYGIMGECTVKKCCEMFFADDLITERENLLNTEPYKRIKVTYENNIATIEVEDSEETYQFQIEFTETGDKISKITYIDPMASMSEEEKKEYVVEHEVIPAYEKYISENLGPNDYSVYNLIYIDEDDIPELLFDDTADGRGTLVISYQNGEIMESAAWCRGFNFNYIPRENKMVYSSEMLGDVSGYVAHLENGILVEEHSYYFDLNDETGEGGTYQMDSVDCSEEEYNNFVETYFKDENMIYGWQTYSSIQEAYENLGKITF